MFWLHPWAILFGAMAAGIPIAVHFLTRPRPVRLPLSTIRFVQEAVRQRRARHWLRDLIVLALRALAVLLVALTIARLQVGQPALVSAADTHEAVRVVVLDVSQSMAASQHGIQLFERARSLAANHLGYRGDLRADLLFAGAAARPVLEHATANFAALRDELAVVQPRPERLNLQAALNRAAEILAAVTAPGTRHELVVVSDFQRTNWATADFSTLPEDTVIQLESVAPAEPLANLGVLRVELQGRAEPGRSVRLEVEVGNYGPAARRARADVSVGDQSFQLEGLCPPDSSATLSHEFEPRGPGWHPGEARLVAADDALVADDVRPFVLEVRRPASYALVTRQPATARPSSSYFLERALVPATPRPGQTGQSVDRIDPQQLSRDRLLAADLIALDHPGKLPQESIDLLVSLLRRGRSMLYVAAESVDATNLSLIAGAAGSALQMPVDFVPPPTGHARRDLFLAETRRGERPWQIFGDELPALVAPLRFSGGLATRRREGALLDDVLATFGDRSACLVVTSCDAGSFAVLNADLSATNLPRSPIFVPFIGELTERLLEQRRGAGQVQSGEPFAVYLPPDAFPVAGLKVEAPADGGTTGELIEESTGVLWRMRPAGPPGIYCVRRGESALYSAACSLPPQESDLRPIESSVLTQRLAGGRKVFYRSAGSEEGELDDRWSWFAAACVMCLLCEVMALKGFRT